MARPSRRVPRSTRTLTLSVLLLLPLLSAFSCESRAPAGALTVYVYDSFSAKGGLGPLMKAAYQKRYGRDTQFVVFGSAGEALNQAQLEGEATRADLVLGMDETLLPRALEQDLFVACTECLEGVEVRLDPKGRLVPFDYGYLALVYDGAKTKIRRPLTLNSLGVDPQLRNQLAWIDPRTSSLGLTFLGWTRQTMNDKQAEKFWREMGSQVLTFSPGWSGAYGLFLKGEAQFVLSYTTSPAYHLSEDPKSQIKAVYFPEGQMRQTEGVGIVRHSKKQEWAKDWVKLLLSEEIQKQLPTTQWMYPARGGTPLPEVFASLPKVTQPIALDESAWAENRTKWLREWTRWVAAVQ